MPDLLTCPTCGGHQVEVKDCPKEITFTCQVCGWRSHTIKDKRPKLRGAIPLPGLFSRLLTQYP